MEARSQAAFDLLAEPTLPQFIARLFTSDFMPHGHCFFWRPEILWLHVLSDFLIGFAYYLIPLAIFHFVRKRRDLVFHWMFLLFAVFILACGTTHFMNIWTMWHGTYRLDGIVKLITALASIATAILLYPLIPKALALKSSSQLEQEVKERTVELKKANDSLMDLTARLNDFNQELVQSNSELEQFAYVASHDLQEPLRTVSNYADLFEKSCASKLNEEEKQYLHFILEGADRSQSLIRDLLEFARIGNRGGEASRVDLKQVMSEVLMNLQTSIAETHAEIICDPLPVINADRSQMVQLFQNLISNAIKYRSEKPLNIRISASETKSDWTFCVGDNGIGIEPRYQDRIFGLFQRLHPRGRYAGTGIGLAICKKIAELHRGKIWVESDKGKGATFYIELPKQQQTRMGAGI